MRMPGHLRFWVSLLLYAMEVFGVIVPGIVANTGGARLGWVFAGVTVMLYATTSLLALWRKDGDPRVVLFMYSALVFTLTIVLRWRPLGLPPSAMDVLHLAAVCLVFVAVLPLGIHLAALIPRRNPIVIRHPWMIWGSYALAGVLAMAAFVWELDAALHVFPLVAHLPPKLALVGVVRASWVVAGWVALSLYASAAKHDESTEGRRQALVVFAGVLPWVLNVTAAILIPAYTERPFYQFVEAIVVLIVPVALLVSILRYRLFDVSVLIRRGLIYGCTMGLLTAAMFVAGSALGELAARTLGIRPTVWWLAALFFVGGALFQPLARRIGRQVDARFFREKVELRRLQQKIIPELATCTVEGGVVDHLVRRVRGALTLRSAALLLGDRERQFYRVRSSDGELAGGTAASGAVITGADLATWADLLTRGRPFAPPERAGESAELRTALRALAAEYVVPIRFSDLLVGLLLLGPSQNAWRLDVEDIDALEGIAHQASAMLENARLLDLAVHDGLTRLPRAQFAFDQIRAEVERSRRSFRPFAVAMIDVDGFKGINDSSGHQVGDAVLKAVVERLRCGSRSLDLLARYGGDEFLLLLPNTPREGAAAHALELCRAVAATAVVAGEREVAVTISMGVCALTAEGDLAEPARLVERADAALYEAKRGGRNRVAVFGAEPFQQLSAQSFA